MEGGSDAGFAFYPDLPFVCIDDVLDYFGPESCAAFLCAHGSS